MRDLSRLRFVCASSCGIAFVLTLAGWSAEAEAQKKLRIATRAPQHTLLMKYFHHRSKKIEQATGGAVTVLHDHRDRHGDARDVIRKLRRGRLDGAELTSAGLALIDESILVLELPLMFNSIDEMQYVRGKMWPYFRKKFEKRGFVLGEPGDVGWTYLYARRASSVQSLYDLRRGVAWFESGDRLIEAVFKELGVHWTSMSVKDISVALEEGQIDVVYATSLTALVHSNTSAKYRLSIPISYAISASVTRTAIWKTLTNAERQAITEITTEQSQAVTARLRRDNSKALKKQRQHGMKIVNPEDVLLAFEAASGTVWSRLVGTAYSQSELDTVLRYRAEFRGRE